MVKPMVKPILRCEHCQEDFVPRHAKGDSYVPRFCSRQCHGKSKRSRMIQVQCVQCQKVFDRKEWHAQKTQNRGPFCGFRCYGQWQKENMKGPANPSWKGEDSPERESAQWHRNRRYAQERDGACLVCGSHRRLAIHHKIPWESNQVDPHAMDNLATLCRRCHDRIHSLIRRVAKLEPLKAELDSMRAALE